MQDVNRRNIKLFHCHLQTKTDIQALSIAHFRVLPGFCIKTRLKEGRTEVRGDSERKETPSLSLPLPYPLRKCHQVSFVRKDFFLCMHSLLSSFFFPRAIEVKIKLSPVGFIELFCFISLVLKVYLLLERFSYDLEMKTREQTETKNEWKQSDLIGLSNGYKRAWLLVG